MSKYFVFTSYIFRKSRLTELRSLSAFKILDNFNNVFIIEAGRGLVEKAKEANLIFIYSIFEVCDAIELSSEGYLYEIESSVNKLAIDVDVPMKYECYDVNSKRGYSAKDVEVMVGSRLENEGIKINMEKPAAIAYSVLINMKCYSGYSLVEGLMKPFLNPERHYLKAYSGISRAELKLHEALDEFDIGGKRGMAIDMGAAPGGWSKVLYDEGFKVLAIDPADLNYRKLGERGVAVKEAIEGIDAGETLLKSENPIILHIKSGTTKLHSLGIPGKACIVVNDMNIEAAESARSVLELKDCFAKDCLLIMTVKCITKNADKYLSITKRILEGDFKIQFCRVLPSNRQEITLFARRI